MVKNRIFIGLIDIAGFFDRLKIGFDQIGTKSDLYLREMHPFGYDSRKLNLLQRTFYHFSRWKNTRQNIFIKYIISVLQYCLSIPLFLFSLAYYDVYIFGFKQSFFPKFGFLDLKILRKFNKKIIFHFFGSDARPPYVDGALATAFNYKYTNLLIKITKKQKRDIKVIEKYADVIINHPPTAQFHEKSFVQYLHIGIPTIIENNNYTNEITVNFPIRILHCPSVPKAKGSDTIRATINKLIDKGYKIDFIEITGKSNKYILDAITHADFVIDQLYSNNPMPGFVSEAAMFKKPAIICGYYHKEIEKILPPSKIPPSLYTHPNDLEYSILKLIEDRKFRLELGQKAYNFVRDEWNPKTVALRYLWLINDKAPASWFYDPYKIEHVHGGAISEKDAKDFVSKVIKAGGKSALQLSDKPDLEKLFIDFAAP